MKYCILQLWFNPNTGKKDKVLIFEKIIENQNYYVGLPSYLNKISKVSIDPSITKIFIQFSPSHQFC